MTKPDTNPFTGRIEEALVYAAQLHAGQKRKISEVPYLSHLLSVAALVMEMGGEENEAIAALLHDAPEEQGGRKTLEEIRRRFGERVAEIVESCTDTFETPKPDWRPRKEAHLARLRQASPEALRVILADKLHNARSILLDFQRMGDALWDYFNGGTEGTLWYYNQMVAILNEGGDKIWAAELERVVAEIERLAAESEG